MACGLKIAKTGKKETTALLNQGRDFLFVLFLVYSKEAQKIGKEAGNLVCSQAVLEYFSEEFGILLVFVIVLVLTCPTISLESASWTNPQEKDQKQPSNTLVKS